MTHKNPDEDSLQAEAIHAILPAPSRILKIIYHSEIDSTNNAAKILAQKGAKKPTLIITDYQTRGRGQFSKQWESPPGVNILLSYLFHPSIHPKELNKISIDVAKIAARVLKKMTGLPVRPQWPNDLVLNGKKLGGILIESTLRANWSEVPMDQKSPEYLIIGIGINVNDTFKYGSPKVKETAISLRLALERKVPRLPIVGKLTEEILKRFVE